MRSMIMTVNKTMPMRMDGKSSGGDNDDDNMCRVCDDPMGPIECEQYRPPADRFDSSFPPADHAHDARPEEVANSRAASHQSSATPSHGPSQPLTDHWTNFFQTHDFYTDKNLGWGWTEDWREHQGHPGPLGDNPKSTKHNIA